MTYSYTAIAPRKPQRDPSRSKERKAATVSRRNARRARAAAKWGF